MSEKNDDHWLSSVAEGGLPQILAGPAGKAISRLIGAAVEIPAVWLEGHAQAIKDQTDARSIVARAIAQSVSDEASKNPEVLIRAANTLLNRAYRTQQNREAVARIALDDLARDSSSIEHSEPAEEWMLKFEKYSEDASSDDLRLLFGRILSGEIRSAGSIAPATLHFISMLDRSDADLILRVLPLATFEGAVYFEAIKPSLSIPETARLEHAGLWSADKSLNFEIDQTGLFLRVTRPGSGFAIRAPANLKFSIDAAILSRAGLDLLKVLGTTFNHEALADCIKSKGVQKYYAGEIVTEGERASMLNPNVIYDDTK